MKKFLLAEIHDSTVHTHTQTSDTYC